MELKELIKEDSTFSESSFLAKVDNTYIMLLSAIMTDNLPKVKHKLSSTLYEKYNDFLKELNSNNQQQLYDELNVKSSEIINIDKTPEKYIIEVKLISRYMDYQIDKTTKEYISGINDHRIEKTNYLTFEKLINAKDSGVIKKCPGCNASIDSNRTGICPYCGTSFNLVDYDWILTALDEGE